ncbi:peptidase inhibitor i9 [Ceratobasidium sp. AG-Ba]|nr:peptidase inhibitor i9 [Ceratobasidium sp. AG-Ba]
MAWFMTLNDDLNHVKAKVLYEYEILNGYSAELNDKALAIVAGSRDVKQITQERTGGLD